MGFLSSLKPKSRSGAVNSSVSGSGRPDIQHRQSRTTVEECSIPVEDCSIAEPNFLTPKPLILPASPQASFTTARSLNPKTPHSTKPKVRTPADLAGADTAAAGGSASDGDSVIGEDSAGSSRMLPNLLLSEAEVQEMLTEELSRTSSSAASLGHALSIHQEGGTSSRLGTSTPGRNFTNNITFHRNKSLADSGCGSPKSVSHVSFRMMPSSKSLLHSRSGKSAGSTSGSNSNAWAEYSTGSAGVPAAATAADEDLLIAAMDSCLDSLTAAVHLAKADSQPAKKQLLSKKEPLRAKRRMAAAAAEFHRSTSGGRNSSGGSTGGGGSSGGGVGGSVSGGGSSGGGSSGGGGISAGGAVKPSAAIPSVSWSDGGRGISGGGAVDPSAAATPAVSWSGILEQPGRSALVHKPKGLTIDTENHSLNPSKPNGGAAAVIEGRAALLPSSSLAGEFLSNWTAGNSSGGSGRHVIVSVGNKMAPSDRPEQLVASQASRDLDSGQQEVQNPAVDGVMPFGSATGGVVSSLHQSVSTSQDGMMGNDYGKQQNLSNAGRAPQQQQQQQWGSLGSGDGVMSAARPNSSSHSGTHSGASNAHTAVDIGYAVPMSADLQQQQQQPRQDLKNRRLSWSPSQQQQVPPQGTAARFSSSTGSRVVYSRDSNDSSTGDARGLPVAAGGPTSFLAPQPPTSARSGSRRPSASAAKAKTVGRTYGVA